jgi:hypothetical protein
MVLRYVKWCVWRESKKRKIHAKLRVSLHILTGWYPELKLWTVQLAKLLPPYVTLKPPRWNIKLSPTIVKS